MRMRRIMRMIQKDPLNRLKLREVLNLAVCTYGIKRYFVCRNPYRFAGSLKIRNMPVPTFFKLSQNREHCRYFFVFTIKRCGRISIGWDFGKTSIGEILEKEFIKLTETQNYRFLRYIFFRFFSKVGKFSEEPRWVEIWEGRWKFRYIFFKLVQMGYTVY